MHIKLTFFGASQNVTGSCYLIEANGCTVMVDCGMYQERNLKQRNWDPFPIQASGVDAVLLTHAHLDHCGRLPKLVKEGFNGRIIATAATADIVKIILKDSAHIQEEDVKYKEKRHKKQGKVSKFPYKALYTSSDVEKTLPLFERSGYNKEVTIGDGIVASFYEAGHIFGSSSIKIKITQGDESRTIVFSGDVGRWDVPIIEDPYMFEQADYLLIESTYGNRTHHAVDDIPGELERVVNETYQAGGNILIPSFAVERTQELLYYLNMLYSEGKIPKLKVFIDSPMAIRVTEVFKNHPELFDEETMDLIHKGAHPIDFPGLEMTRRVSESKAINKVKSGAIIISGSGMCTGGRIKHHLLNNIQRAECTVLFVGYQAYGTLGRTILEKPAEVRIFGRQHKRRARIEKINGFSGHADKNELVRWLSSMKIHPRKVFITHGEAEASKSFKKFLTQKRGFKCVVPEYMQEVILD
jgi:metallo-beta-lactamase family protein